MYLCNFCFLIIIQHNFHWCCHLVCWASKVSQTVSPVTWWEEVRSSEWHKSTQRRPSVRYCLILEFKAKYKFSINKFWFTFPWLQMYLIIHVTVGLFSFDEKWQKIAWNMCDKILQTLSCIGNQEYICCCKFKSQEIFVFLE